MVNPVNSHYYTGVSICTNNFGGTSTEPVLQFDFNSANKTYYVPLCMPTHWTIVPNATPKAGWNHIAIVVDQSTQSGSLYLNGEMASSGKASGAFPTNRCDNIVLGRSGDGSANGRGFNGSIRYFCTFDEVLTTEQIVSVMNETA